MNTLDIQASFNAIQRRRQEKGLTAKQVADALHCTEQSVYYWEYRSLPKLKTLIALTSPELLDCKLDDLLIATRN